jgi:hypothetical protein
MTSAHDDVVVASLGQLADAGQQLAAAASDLAAAIAEDPPQAARIGGAIRVLTARMKAIRMDVVAQALKRWALLNPGLTREKF